MAGPGLDMASKAISAAGVWRVSAMCFLTAALCLVMLPLVGAVPLSWERAFSGQAPDSQILWDIRVPRVVLSLLSGGALSLAGVLFQALLRNALATPDTLGVSSGAALGAFAAICFAFPSLWAAAFAGAVLTLFVVLGVSAKRQRVSAFTLLLAGVTVTSICTAAMLCLQSIATLGQSIAISRWLMGGIEPVSYSTLAILAAALIAVLAYATTQARQWNLLAMGEDWAFLRGVGASKLIYSGYFMGSFLTASVTALTGPIGFVGLIVPHALRLWLGPDHRLLLISSFLLGGAFLAICDTVARTVIAPAEVPVGVITAILGGPFFIWLLRTR